MPVAPVALHLAERGRYLIGSGLDFLQADDVGPIALDPLLDLRLTRADAVHVPRADGHGEDLSAKGAGRADGARVLVLEVLGAEGAEVLGC